MKANRKSQLTLDLFFNTDVPNAPTSGTGAIIIGKEIAGIMAEVSFPRFFVFQGHGIKPPFSAHAAW